MAERGPIVYIAGELPKLSETFVYREVFALRERGVGVLPGSIRRSTGELGDERLDLLRSETIPLYSRGFGSILAGYLAELVTHPVRTIGTWSRGKLDAVLGSDVPRTRRLKVLYQCMAGIALARMLRPKKPTHIHAHFAHVPATVAMYAARQLGVGFSFTGHANDLFRERTLLNAKLKRAAFVSCISEWHRGWYREIEPIDDERAPVIRCGVDTAAFAPGMPESGLISCVARLVEKKGADTLIEAVGLLRDRGVGCRCVIAGDGPERERLAGMVEQLNLTDRVELLGSVPNDRVRELVRNSGVFCLPCRDDSSGDRDGIPVALMEAMACGVATVSGDLPAIRELIDDGVSGRLVPGGDAAVLADVLESILADEAERSRLGVGGRARIEEEFSIDVNAARLIRAFERCGAIA